MTVYQRRRRFLAGLAVGGLFVLIWGCRSGSVPEGTLQLWTLQLAPKFNPYMTSVIDVWDQRHPDTPVRWTDLPWGSVERKLLDASDRFFMAAFTIECFLKVCRVRSEE